MRVHSGFRRPPEVEKRPEGCRAQSRRVEFSTPWVVHAVHTTHSPVWGTRISALTVTESPPPLKSGCTKEKQGGVDGTWSPADKLYFLEAVSRGGRVGERGKPQHRPRIKLL